MSFVEACIIAAERSGTKKAFAELPMAEWDDAWLNGRSMPAHGFPPRLLSAAQAIAEEWLFDARFRCILEEWISRDEADEVMGNLLWSGFRLHGQPQKRVPPIPVLVKLLYSEPYPADSGELEDRMRELFTHAVRDWVAAFVKHGRDLEGAP
jgi:hypothetical protein